MRCARAQGQFQRRAFGRVILVEHHRGRKDEWIFHLARRHRAGPLGRVQRRPLAVGEIEEDALLRGVVLQRLVVRDRVNATRRHAAVQIAGTEPDAHLKIVPQHGGDAETGAIAETRAAGRGVVRVVEVFVAAAEIAVELERRHPLGHPALHRIGGGEVLVGFLAEVVGFLDGEDALVHEFFNQLIGGLRKRGGAGAGQGRRDSGGG